MPRPVLRLLREPSWPGVGRLSWRGIATSGIDLGRPADEVATLRERGEGDGAPEREESRSVSRFSASSSKDMKSAAFCQAMGAPINTFACACSCRW